MAESSTTTTEPTPRDLLRQAIDESGMSARAFATKVLLRNERTVRRWLEGTAPIGKEVVAWLHLPAGARLAVPPPAAEEEA